MQQMDTEMEQILMRPLAPDLRVKRITQKMRPESRNVKNLKTQVR